jgi:hypothetical protein
MQLTADLSQLAPEVRNGIVRRLQHEDLARHALGLADQARMKRLQDTATIGTYKGEIGPPQIILSQDQWQRAMQRYGQLCMMDPDFVPWLLRKNDDMRVKAIGTRAQVGWRAADGKHARNGRNGRE